MGPVLFVMAIMGCADTDAACRQVRVADTLYATVESCQAATATVLGRNTDLDFPLVEARCTAAAADSAQAMLTRFPRG